MGVFSFGAPLGLRDAVTSRGGGSNAGVPRQENTFPWDPEEGLCIGPYGGPRVVAFSRNRGAPVAPMGPQFRPNNGLPHSYGAVHSYCTLAAAFLPARETSAENQRWKSGLALLESESSSVRVHGNLAHKKTPPPQDYPRALSIGLL